jgi:3-dehydroquinate dehydratase
MELDKIYIRFLEYDMNNKKFREDFRRHRISSRTAGARKKWRL